MRLLLATSNRSEAAVGYATMDGDTSGGLSPIAGIDKAFLRRWLRWCETHGPDGIGPLPELAVVNEQAPTAELRPPSSKQTDEDDLMPYELLDAIERAAIRDKQSPQRDPAASWRPSSRSTRGRSSPSGSSGSSASGAATSGSASATPPASTSTTKTSTPKPGAASRSSAAAIERELAELKKLAANKPEA